MDQETFIETLNGLMKDKNFRIDLNVLMVCYIMGISWKTALKYVDLDNYDLNRFRVK